MTTILDKDGWPALHYHLELHAEDYIYDEEGERILAVVSDYTGRKWIMQPHDEKLVESIRYSHTRQANG